MLYIPEVYSDYCGGRWWMERIYGIPVFGCGGRWKERHQRRAAGGTRVKVFLHPGFRDSFFRMRTCIREVFTSGHERPENPAIYRH